MVTDDDLRPSPDRAPRTVHSERLWVPLWWWAALAVFAAILVASDLALPLGPEAAATTAPLPLCHISQGHARNVPFCTAQIGCHIIAADRAPKVRSIGA